MTETDRPLWRWARTEMIMGLPISIHLRERPGSNSEVGAGMDVIETQTFSVGEAEAAVESAFDRLRRCDHIFSPYLADSNLNAVRNGSMGEKDAGSEFAEVMILSLDAKERTAGFFDVHFAGPLDPSGLVKGWAAERAAALLAPLPVDFYLNAGGDIACATTGSPWRIGVEHPADPQGLITVVALHGESMATSGTAHRGGHIIAPGDHRAAAGIRQVTVIGPSLTWADIWATALVAAGPGPVLDRAGELTGRCTADGYQFLTVLDDLQVFATQGFEQFQVADQPRPPATILPRR